MTFSVGTTNAIHYMKPGHLLLILESHCVLVMVPLGGKWPLHSSGTDKWADYARWVPSQKWFPGGSSIASLFQHW